VKELPALVEAGANLQVAKVAEVQKNHGFFCWVSLAAHIEGE